MWQKPACRRPSYQPRDVACATVLDIVCSMLTPLLLIVVLMGKNMLELIRTYRNNFLIVLGVGVAVLLLLFLVLRWKFREPLQRYFEKYRKLLNRKILLRVLGVFLLYVVQYIISTAMYAIPAAFLFDVPGVNWDCSWEHTCSPGSWALSHRVRPAASVSVRRL